MCFIFFYLFFWFWSKTWPVVVIDPLVWHTKQSWSLCLTASSSVCPLLIPPSVSSRSGGWGTFLGKWKQASPLAGIRQPVEKLMPAQKGPRGVDSTLHYLPVQQLSSAFSSAQNISKHLNISRTSKDWPHNTGYTVKHSSAKCSNCCAMDTGLTSLTRQISLFKSSSTSIQTPMQSYS